MASTESRLGDAATDKDGEGAPWAQCGILLQISNRATTATRVQGRLPFWAWEFEIAVGRFTRARGYIRGEGGGCSVVSYSQSKGRVALVAGDNGGGRASRPTAPL